MAHFPAAGEITIFDRSWYNRAGVEHVAQQPRHDECSAAMCAFEVGRFPAVELPRSHLAKDDVCTIGPGKDAVAYDRRAGGNEREFARIAVVNICRADACEK